MESLWDRAAGRKVGRRTKSYQPVAPPDDWRDSRLFLTVQEVMHLTAVERTTCYGLLRDGRIPGRFKAGSLVRVRVSVFAPWLDGEPAKKGGRR